MKKVSVIMASYLGFYNGCASNRPAKFVRAVNSFLNQTYENKELIIVSDGCAETNRIYEEQWKQTLNVKLFPSPKQALYSGGIRSIGCKMASGDVIMYLDGDDVLGKNHIQTIMDQFDTEQYAWVYYDDYMVLNKEFSKLFTRVVEPRYGSMGTSSVAHLNFFKHEKYKGKKFPDWGNGCGTGYGHDWMYAMQLAATGGSFIKLKQAPMYLVCHHRDGDF